MKKVAIVTTCFVALILMSFALTDEPRYKNLKVLPKGTTKQQMDSVMKHFAAALGVKCNFCHVFNQESKAMDFASDANEHKGISRDMMRMTQKLNKKYFDVKDSKALTAKVEVTCLTCHNGKAHPAKFAQPQGQQGGGQQPKPQGPPPAQNQ
jgi:hypothetical protein